MPSSSSTVARAVIPTGPWSVLLKRGERIVIKPSVPMLLEKVTIEVQCTDSKNTSRPLQTSVTMTGATGHTVTLGTVSPLDQMELRTDIVLTEGHTYYLHTRGPGCVLIMGRFVDVNGRETDISSTRDTLIIKHPKLRVPCKAGPKSKISANQNAVGGQGRAGARNGQTKCIEH